MNGKPEPAELVLLGVVTGVRGLKGEVRIRSYTAAPEDLCAYGPLWDAAGEASYKVRVTGQAKGQLIARIAGIADRTQAEALKGLELHIPRGSLPAPEDDEFYHSDLVGLEAVSTTGEVLGTVSAVDDFGAGDVLEVTGGPYSGLMVPFTKAIVPEVSLAEGRLTVDPPPGLLEPPEEEAKGKAPEPDGPAAQTE